MRAFTRIPESDQTTIAISTKGGHCQPKRCPRRKAPECCHVCEAVTKMSLLWTFAPLLLSWCLPQALAKTYNLPKNVFIPPDIQYWAQNDVNTTIYDSQGLPWFCYTVRQTHCIPLFPLPSNFRTTRRPFKPGDHHGVRKLWIRLNMQSYQPVTFAGSLL